MIEAAEALGFTYSRNGCACSGGPNKIFTKEHNGKMYTLRIWPGKGIWRLYLSGYQIEGGQRDELTTKIKLIWD